MLGALIGGIATGVGNLIQQRKNRDIQKWNVNKTIQAQKDAAELEWNRGLEMWDKQNTYNSPEAQMERLRQAGLNPNMVYGSGTATATAAQATMPKYNAPRPQYEYAPMNFMSALGAYQDFAMKNAQIDTLEAQARLKGKEAQIWTEKDWFGDDGTITGESPMYHRMKAQLEKLDRENTLGRKMVPYQLEYAEGRNRNMDIQMGKILQDTEYTKLKNKWYETKMFGDMANQALRTIGGMIPSNVGKKAAGNLTTGSRGINQKTRTPAYNSTESWRQMGY